MIGARKSIVACSSVDAATAVEHVVVTGADQPFDAGESVQALARILCGREVEIDGYAVEGVGEACGVAIVAAVEQIVAVAVNEGVLSLAAVQTVVTGSAVENIVRPVTVQDVIACVAIQLVASGARLLRHRAVAVDGVIAVTAMNDIGAGQAIDHIVFGCAGEGVGAVGAVYCRHAGTPFAASVETLVW